MVTSVQANQNMAVYRRPRPKSTRWWDRSTAGTRPSTGGPIMHFSTPIPFEELVCWFQRRRHLLDHPLRAMAEPGREENTSPPNAAKAACWCCRSSPASRPSCSNAVPTNPYASDSLGPDSIDQARGHGSGRNSARAWRRCTRTSARYGTSATGQGVHIFKAVRTRVRPARQPASPPRRPTPRSDEDGNVGLERRGQTDGCPRRLNRRREAPSVSLRSTRPTVLRVSAGRRSFSRRVSSSHAVAFEKPASSAFLSA